MKKIVKLICFILFLAGCGALIGCYCTMPERTKEAMDIVVEYINKPLPIVGFSILTLGIVAYEIFSHTSFGKKTINQLKVEIENQKQLCLSYQEKGQNALELAYVKEEEQKAVLEAYSNEIELIKDKVVKLCETSPNVKVKAIGEELKENIDTVKQELSENLDKIENGLSDYLKEKVDIDELKDKIAELETLLKGMVEQNEKDNQTEEE